MTRFKTIGRVRWIAGGFLLAAAGWGCSKEPAPAQSPPDAAADKSAADAAADVPGADSAPDRVFGRSDVRVDTRTEIPPDAGPTPPANVLFPEPPELPCSTVSDCEFPPSACADPSCVANDCPGYRWVVYYDHPQCTAGKCVFEQRYFQCTFSTSCSNGGCRFNGTALP